MPTYPQRLIEINAYKNLEPILYHEPHKKLQKRVLKIKDLKEQIQKEQRMPTEPEVRQIAKYNEQMQ